MRGEGEEKRGLGLFLQTAVAVTGADGMVEGGSGLLSLSLVLYRQQEKVITEAQCKQVFFHLSIMMVEEFQECLV